MVDLRAEQVKLGKKPGVVDDPRTFKLKSLLATPKKLSKPPAQSYVGKGEEIRLYANNRYGCCTCASMAHRIDVQERASRQQELQLTDEHVLAAYTAVTGFDRNRPETDNGAYMLDVLNYMRTKGMGREADQTSHTIHAFASVPLLTQKSGPAGWKLASWMFGGIYLGAWLPLSAATQLNAGKRWTVVNDESGVPGSWGGHAMHMVGYSDSSAVFATWGQRIRVSWDWIVQYVDEAYVVISEDFMRADKTPQGFNHEALEDALKGLT